MAKSILDRLLGRPGKRTEDIELPNESGRRDPRLPRPFDAARTGRNLREGFNAIQGLINAEKRK